MFIDQLARAVESAPYRELDELAAAVWRAYAAGTIDDDQAQSLAEAVARRRGQGHARLAGTWRKAPRQRSPDRRRSLERRRLLAKMSPMPARLAAGFTVGELATLHIVADEVRRYGVCGLHIDAIAARAGVCRSTAQNALAEARRLGLLTREERRRRGQPSLTNIVRIVSKEWRAWLSTRPRGLAYNFSNTAESIQDSKATPRRGERAQSRLSEGRFARSRPRSPP